jgi:RNA polymerase sigma-70 factor (subfamily 1)
MSPLDTLQLLDDSRRGDRAALDALFAQVRPRLSRVLAARAGAVLLRQNELDDLVQEACIEAVRLLPTFTYQGKDSFFRWLSALAVHKLGNLRRTAQADKRDPQREQRIGGPGSELSKSRVAEPGQRGPGPRTLVASDEGIDQLFAALRELSATDRDIITMARIDGLSLTEIAERTGRTRNAVALVLSRALRKLRTRIDGE